MDEGDLAVLLYRAAHAPERPTVELHVEHDRQAEAVLDAHVADEVRRLTHGMLLGGEQPERDPDATVRSPGWLFDDLWWEIGEAAEALGRPAVRVTAHPESLVPVLREHFLDRIELLVDVGTGLLLRLVEVYDGRAVRTVTVRVVGPEAEVPEPPPGEVPGPELGAGPSMGAEQVGKAVRMTVLTFGRMALDSRLRRILCGGDFPDLTSRGRDFQRTEPAPLDEPLPSVEEVVRLLALARPPGISGTVRGPYFQGRFALADERRFRLDQDRAAGPFELLAQACDGERHYRLLPDRLVVEPAELHAFPLAALRRPRGELRQPLTVRDVVDWEGRRAFRVAAGDSDLVLDAGTGLVLANAYLELHDLGPAPEEPGHYRLQAPPGVPVVESDGGPLGDALLPPPVRAGLEGAAWALGGLAEGIARVLGR